MHILAKAQASATMLLSISNGMEQEDPKSRPSRPGR